MKKRINILILMAGLFLTKHSFAQDTLTFANVNTISLEFYIGENWESLIDFGLKAQSENIDFYYLNYRMAVAYQKLKNYRVSALYFEKAIKMVQGESLDDFFLQSLNLNYQYLHEYSKSLQLNKKTNYRFSEKYNWKNTFRSISFFGAGAQIPPYKDSIEANAPNDPHQSYDVQNDMKCWGVVLTGSVFPAVDFHFAYFNYFSNYTNILKDPFQGQEHEFVINQNQLYFDFDWQINTSNSLSLFLSAIKRYSNPLILTESNSSPWLNKYEVVEETNYEGAVGIEFKHSFAKIDIKSSALYSNLMDSNQVQFSVGANYYPFGNLNFYILSDFYASKSQQKPQLSLEEKVGFKVTNWLWLEANASFGKIKTMTHDKGFSVYNVPDEINLIVGASSIIVIGKHLELNIMYNYFSQTTELTAVSPFNGNSPIITTYPFNKHIVTGGISWKF